MLAFAAIVAAGYVQRDKLVALAAAPPAPETAGIKATAKQERVKLTVDGKEIGTLPQELKDLTPGVHSLVFQGEERYAPYKLDVNLGVNEVRELEPVSLKIAKGSATLDVKTPGATVTLVSGDDHRELTDTSQPIEIDTSKNWKLEASKAGYKPLSIPLTFTDEAKKTFVVALEESKPSPAETPPPAEKPADTPAASPDKAAAKHAAVAPPEPPAAPAAAPKRAQPAPEPPPAKAPAPQAAAASGECKLNMNSLPISRITLDGRPIGMTPKIGVAVPPGTHSVMFVTDTARKATTATCKAGEQKTVAVRL